MKILHSGVRRRGRDVCALAKRCVGSLTASVIFVIKPELSNDICGQVAHTIQLWPFSDVGQALQ